MRLMRLPLLLCLVLFLSACQTTQGTRESSYPWPYPEKPSGAITQPAKPVLPDNPEDPPSTLGIGRDTDSTPPSEVVVATAPQAPVLPNYPRTAEEISGKAVVSLMRQARESRGAGQIPQAQAALERALKIEPRNYFAWAALAACFLDLRDYDQAISLAGKSNSLARGNIYVELDNYRVLQEARAALGDNSGALQAQARADEIQQLLQQARPESVQP